MRRDFLIPLKAEAFLPWRQVWSIYKASQQPGNHFRFGIATGISIKPFPVLKSIADQYDLKEDIYVIRMTHGFRLPIHVDGTPGQTNCASVIWPIYNCDERSPTEWYGLKSDMPTYDVIKGSHFLKNEEDAFLVHTQAMSTALRCPYLFRSDILHRGSNKTAALRIIVKWEMKCSTWSEAINKVQGFSFL